MSEYHATAAASTHSPTEERAILTVTCLAAFLLFNSFGSIGVALPAIQRQFGSSSSKIQWITLMGVVTISSLSFRFGRLGGYVGQRRLYKAGVAFYAAGAGLGGISTSFRQLLGARAVMALGLAMALPMSKVILAASFAPERRGRVLGFFTPANQKIAFACVRQEDYGVLAAMLSAFGTAAGTIGITITVALMEVAGGPGLWSSSALFAGAQQFAYACLVPIGLVAVAVGLQQSRRAN